LVVTRCWSLELHHFQPDSSHHRSAPTYPVVLTVSVCFIFPSRLFLGNLANQSSNAKPTSVVSLEPIKQHNFSNALFLFVVRAVCHPTTLRRRSHHSNLSYLQHYDSGSPNTAAHNISEQISLLFSSSPSSFPLFLFKERYDVLVEVRTVYFSTSSSCAIITAAAAAEFTSSSSACTRVSSSTR